MANLHEGSLEDTATWAVAVFALFIFLLSFIIEDGLHRLTKFLKGRKRKSLNRAVKKFKTEMMQLGFLSLLLTLSEIPISKICVPLDLANSFLPCKYAADDVKTDTAVSSSANQRLPGSNSSNLVTSDDYCEAKGMVSLVSREGILQLNILISVLAAFHVLYCILTMFLGMAKMRKWNTWEDETQTLNYQILNDPRRFQLTDQTAIGKRHMKFWSKHPLLLWPVCFVRQFSGSISRIDYMTLRNGFILANFSEGSNFNFLNFLYRAFDDDFEQVVGIRFWIWIFSILFIFFSAHVFYNGYWLPFIPLLIILVVGTKLQVVITKMCVESCKQNTVTRGSFVVKLNDDLFWFAHPKWLLHLLQFVLIQNSFQLAFLTWTWFEYGKNSCFNRKTKDIAIKSAMGIGVQLICGYVTLPLYALVTQMGSSMRKEVFTELVVDGLRNWHKNARHRLSKNGSSLTRKSSNSIHCYSTDDANSVSDYESNGPNINLDLTLVKSSSSTSEIVEEEVARISAPNSDTTSLPGEIIKEKEHPNVMNKIVYNGEISFGSSWRLKMESTSKGSGEMSGEITSIVEEDFNDVDIY